MRPARSAMSRSSSQAVSSEKRRRSSGSTARRIASSLSRSALRHLLTSAHWLSSVDGMTWCMKHGGDAYSSSTANLGGRLRRAGGGIALGEIEDLDEGRWRLRPRHRVLAVDDEAGHAVDAEPPGIDVGGDNLLPALVALQERAGAVAIEPGAHRHLGQDVDVADIQPVLEIGPEQRGHDLVLALLGG